MPRLRLYCLAVLLAALVIPVLAIAGEAPAPLITGVDITGNRMVEEETVRSRIRSLEGTPFDPAVLSEDVKSIFALGYFEDIKVDSEGFEGGLRLTFRLTEKAVVKSVRFEGNDTVKEEDLRKKLDISPMSIYSTEAVSGAIRAFEALYRDRGFYHVQIDADTEAAGEGEVVLVFQVREGAKYRVTEIVFTGNKAFSAGDLRGEMKTKKWNIFSFIAGKGRLNRDVLQYDRQQILSFYQDHGYLDARIGEPEVTVDDEKHRITVTIAVTEGPQYRLGTLDLKGDDLLSLDEAREIIDVKKGDVFRRSAFARGLHRIGQHYTHRGYAYVRVDYSSRLRAEEQMIDVTLLIDRGAQALFGRVTITGNITTRDKVVRRELTFRPGDLFDSDALKDSRRKIMNLGFFEEVNIIPRPVEENVIEVDISLKERLTGAVSLGVGYSSEDKAAGQIRFTESNLFGRGQALQVMAEYGSVRQNYSFSFSEPAIFDSKYSLGLKAFNTFKDYTEYNRKNVGGKITLGRSLWTSFRGFLSFKNESVDISDLTEDASSFITAQEGKKTTRSLRFSLVRDTRDNYFNPTTGNRTLVAYEYAGGFMGGDNYFTKTEVETSFYFPIFWKLVLVLHGQTGTIRGFDDREPPIYEKFFAGGIDTVRGFESRSIGPKDENGDPLGGYKVLVLNTEIIVPLSQEEGLNGVVFFDAGNAYDKGKEPSLNGLRTAVGAGIRWLSPLGPFRLEWGYNLEPEEGEPRSDWAFSIGAFF